MAGKASGPYRSAISGRYVTTKHGKASPQTTVHEASGKSGNTGGSYRSAVSGRFVTETCGNSNPGNTTHEK